MQGAHPSFDVALRRRCPRRRLDDAYAFDVLGLVEARSELARPVAHQHLATVERFAAGEELVPRCLGGPGAARVGSDPARVTLCVGMSIENSRYQQVNDHDRINGTHV